MDSGKTLGRQAKDCIPQSYIEQDPACNTYAHCPSARPAMASAPCCKQSFPNQTRLVQELNVTNRDHEEFRLHPGSTLEISYLDDSSGKTQFFITNASQPAVKEERSDESPLSLHVDFHPEGKHDGLLELENYWGEPVLVLGGAFWELSRNDADGVAITTLPGCEQAKFGCSVEHGQHGIIPSTVDYTRPNGWMRILLITLSAGDGTIDVAVEWPENVDAIVSWSGDLVTPLGDVPAQHKG